MKRLLVCVAVPTLVFFTPLGAQEGTGPTVQAFVFGDAVYAEEEGAPGAGFDLGQIVAHANATLSDRVAFFGELSITPTNSAYRLAMERAILRFEANDAFKLGVGRYHTPVSYWNTEFHHGLWLQGSVARPEAIRFGSRFIPVHFVGAMAEGNFTGTPLHYAAGLGNGRSDNLVGAGDGGDNDGHVAAVISASLRPASLFGFRVGGALYLDKITQPGAVPETDERIASAHVVWARDRVEAIAEVIDVQHSEVGTDTSTGSTAVYVHVGYRLQGRWDDLTPYGRWEDTSIDATDVVFGGVLDEYTAWIGGLRYDFDDFAALKVEYRRQEVGDAEGTNALFLQASFALAVAGG
jgi:hypothetical protein